MFKHLLVSTDGSNLSTGAVKTAARLARQSGARREKCDLIVMASHGRRGLSGLLIGSETHKVLTHTRIPVLMCR